MLASICREISSEAGGGGIVGVGEGVGSAVSVAVAVGEAVAAGVRVTVGLASAVANSPTSASRAVRVSVSWETGAHAARKAAKRMVRPTPIRNMNYLMKKLSAAPGGIGLQSAAFFNDRRGKLRAGAAPPGRAIYFT
jgi:hypothetical protein